MYFFSYKKTSFSLAGIADTTHAQTGPKYGLKDGDNLSYKDAGNTSANPNVHNPVLRFQVHYMLGGKG